MVYIISDLYCGLHCVYTGHDRLDAARQKTLETHNLSTLDARCDISLCRVLCRHGVRHHNFRIVFV